MLENDPGEAVGLLSHAVEGAEARNKVLFVAVVLGMADLSRCAGPLIPQMWGSAEGVVEVIAADLFLRIGWSAWGARGICVLCTRGLEQVGIPECVDFQLLKYLTGQVHKQLV